MNQLFLKKSNIVIGITDPVWVSSFAATSPEINIPGMQSINLISEFDYP